MNPATYRGTVTWKVAPSGSYLGHGNMRHFYLVRTLQNRWQRGLPWVTRQWVAKSRPAKNRSKLLHLDELVEEGVAICCDGKYRIAHPFICAKLTTPFQFELWAAAGGGALTGNNTSAWAAQSWKGLRVLLYAGPPEEAHPMDFPDFIGVLLGAAC